MGDEMFYMPEVEDLAKGLQAIQDDAQVHKASTLQQPKQKVKYKFPILFILIQEPFFKN